MDSRFRGNDVWAGIIKANAKAYNIWLSGNPATLIFFGRPSHKVKDSLQNDSAEGGPKLIEDNIPSKRQPWIPAFAGMTLKKG